MGFLTFNLLDLLDIVLIAVIFRQLYRLVKGTSAYFIILGIFALYLFWIVVRVLNMELTSLILGQVLGVGVIAIIVVFQQEIRKFLLLLGNRYLSHRLRKSGAKEGDIAYLDEIASACEHMSESHTGALIVLARGTDLTFVRETGDVIDALVSQRLLETIFFKNSPLHDGAVLIADGRIVAARCVLPTTENLSVPAYYGMRHRAAIGISEKSDAEVVVVSEQTGKISYVSGGKIKRGISIVTLKELLLNLK